MTDHAPVEDLEWDDMEAVVTDDDLDPSPVIDLDDLPEIVNDHPEG